jgi:1-pyrroline-5-carboxylate dehydrogenase
MNNAHPTVPAPTNEPTLSYAPGSEERQAVKQKLKDLRSQTVEVPAFIGGEAVYPGSTSRLSPPHDHQHTLGEVHQCGAAETESAIDAAMEAKDDWASMDFDDRAAIFLKAADLLAEKYRPLINAATMLGQGKNVHQAEIDAACELIDFLRFNVHFAETIYRDQPNNVRGLWNKMEYRPLEGFVFAVTPFNFTAIQGNLPTAPAIMGNTVVWKPASRSVYSAYFTYKILEEAGLPDGVINMVPADDGAAVGDPALNSEHFAGLHFTGSVATFEHLWTQVAENLDTYTTYPTIVGETGGKDFILTHESANPDQVATAITRASFEYQGQKCSASSRLYIPESLWPDVQSTLFEQIDDISVGPPEDFTNFVNAVIDQRAFDKIVSYIEHARESDDAEIIRGGDYDDSTGYFIEPTVILAHDPKYKTMREEIFGPVTTVYVYPDDEWEETMELIDETSPYALTGAVFARERTVIRQAQDALDQAAGNFYVNDKPTAAIVGQQPFGGARRSGTNDKAGSELNLLRWVSPRSIKESWDAPTNYHYAWNQPDAEGELSLEEIGAAGNGAVEAS